MKILLRYATAGKDLRGIFLLRKAEDGVISVDIAADDNAVREKKTRKDYLMLHAGVIVMKG